MEQKFKIFEKHYNIANEALNPSKKDMQNAVKITTKIYTNINEAKSSKNKYFTCNLCKIVLNDTFREHKKKEHQNVGSCEMCEKTLDEIWKLEVEVHMKSHNAIKHFSCDHCEQKFYVEWRLRST